MRYHTTPLPMHIEILRFWRHTSIFLDWEYGNITPIIIGCHHISTIQHHIAWCRTRHLVFRSSSLRSALLIPKRSHLSLRPIENESPESLSPIIIFAHGINPICIMIHHEKRRVACLYTANQLRFPCTLVETINIHSVRSTLVGIGTYYHCKFITRRCRHPHSHCQGQACQYRFYIAHNCYIYYQVNSIYNV